MKNIYALLLSCLFISHICFADDPKIRELVRALGDSTEDVKRLQIFATLAEMYDSQHAGQEAAKSNYQEVLSLLASDSKALPNLLQACKEQSRLRGIVAGQALFLVMDLANFDPKTDISKEARAAAIQLAFLFLQEGSLKERPLAGAAVLAMQAGWVEKHGMKIGTSFDKAVASAKASLDSALQGGTFETRFFHFMTMLAGRAFTPQLAISVVEIFAEWPNISLAEKVQFMHEFAEVSDELFLSKQVPDFQPLTNATRSRIVGGEEQIAAVVLKAVLRGIDLRMPEEAEGTPLRQMMEILQIRFSMACILIELTKKASSPPP